MHWGVENNQTYQDIALLKTNLLESPETSMPLSADSWLKPPKYADFGYW